MGGYISMIKVSVIIPCYNAEKYLKKSLDIILADKLKEIEIILINDGSTDNTLKLMKEYAKKYSQIKIITQKNAGQGKARNKGIKASLGKYIMFIDIDDFLVKDAISKFYEVAEKQKSDYVYCNFYKHNGLNDIIEKNFYTKNQNKNALLANFAPWGKLIAKKLIKDTNFSFYEGKIFEDIAVIPLLAAQAQNPYYLNEALYFYNLDNNSSTIRTEEYNSKYEDIFPIADYLYESFKNNNLLIKYYAEVEFIFIKGILRSNIMLFAKYKEGLNNITKLRKNVLTKFPHLKQNKYLKEESFKNRLVTFISIYLPSWLLYYVKKVLK